MAWKEFVQVKRDGITLLMMGGLPVLQLLFFGYAINTDVRNIPTVIYDQDGSVESRDLVRRLEATGFYRILAHVRSYDEISRALVSNVARVALVVPVGFGSELRSGGGAQAQLVVDGSDPQTVASASNTAGAMISGLSMDIMVRKLDAAGMNAGTPVELKPTIWYNPELRTAVFVVPGLVGVILTTTMVMLTAIAIARERERGTLEQLIVSPIRPLELVTGKILPYVLVGYVQMSLVLALGKVVFNVPIAGSVFLLYGLASLFISTCLSVGLFFSTVAQTQQQAMQMTAAFTLPNYMMSGFMFPFEGMPEPAQRFAEFLPLTHFLRIVRGITLRGATFWDLEREVIWLSGLLLFTVIATSMRFRKKLG
ncbi:MAG: ABC transporter permease [Polyangiaceae bacterium]|nr:ABC transporter permease [Polyangiaceae bacterium]